MENIDYSRGKKKGNLWMSKDFSALWTLEYKRNNKIYHVWNKKSVYYYLLFILLVSTLQVLLGM